jgi:hypothetical protein
MTPKSTLSVSPCREQSATCRRLAQQVMTAAHRIMLEHIADTWERIAADVEEHDPR